MLLLWELSILLIPTSVFFTFHLFSFLSSITMLILSLQLRLKDCGQKKKTCALTKLSNPLPALLIFDSPHVNTHAVAPL